MPADAHEFTALVYGAQAGVGGLGLQAATAAVGLGFGGPVIALGPGRVDTWPLRTAPTTVRWETAPAYSISWLTRKLHRHLCPGRLACDCDAHLGRWAARRLEALQPLRVYAFTQVGCESLIWAQKRGIPTTLDNPNGHIRGFAQAYRMEWAKWVGGVYRGHPTDAMIERVEREYELADRIRVSSTWAKRSMVEHGVPAAKISVIPQPIDLDRFRPSWEKIPSNRPLRVVFVGSLDMRKGFVYLLRAVRKIGANRVTIELVGGTGERGSKQLLAAERIGLNVVVAPGDPVAAYHRADVFVMPSLEDGFGFVVAEAMACGLPIVVTDQCGAAEWVEPGKTGWVIPAGDEDSLVHALGDAIARRDELPAMGQAARKAAETRIACQAWRDLADWHCGSQRGADRAPRPLDALSAATTDTPQFALSISRQCDC
jgi:glycosyltransferase involved in cell wall biosynthesis